MSLASTSTILGIHLERHRALFDQLESRVPAHIFLGHVLRAALEARLDV